MDWLSRKLETVEDHTALLPAGLKAFLDRELAAGNSIAEAGTGFPSPPVGVWIKLTKGFLTAEQPMPGGVIHRERPMWMWPAECTDEPRHFFITSGKIETPAPKINIPTPPQPLSAPKRPLTPPSAKPSPPRLTKTIYAPLDEFEKAGLDKKVSAAIAEHLGLMWDEATEQKIRHAVGDEGVARVKEIAAWADRADFWQHARNLDRAYTDIKRQLADKYPFLSPAAIERLATRSAWSWK